MAGTFRRLLLVFAVCATVYFGAVVLVCRGPAFPLDDAFIHLQFARNLFLHHQQAFNVGVPSSGASAPGFLYLLAAVYALARNWWLASYVLGIAATLGSLALVVRLLRAWTGREEAAFFGGLVFVVAFPTIVHAFSGMESSLFVLGVLLGLDAYRGTGRRARLLASGWFAITVWIRPETMVLAPLVAVERIWAVRRREADARDTTFELLGHGAIWAVVVCAYCAYNWSLDRHLMPSTFAAKAVAHMLGRVPAHLDGLPSALSHHRPGGALLALTIWPLFTAATVAVGLLLDCLPLAHLLPRAFRETWSRPRAPSQRLALLFLFVLPLARGAIEPMGSFLYHFHRYFAPLNAIAILLGVGMLWGDPQGPLWTPRRRRAAIGFAVASGLVGGALAVGCTWNIATMQVGMARWIAANTRPGELVATNDIGAIGFISERPILDLIGLVEPGIVREHLEGRSPFDYVERRKPGLAVVFPEWFAEFATNPSYVPVHTVSVHPNLICGGDDFVAYRRRGVP